MGNTSRPQPHASEIGQRVRAIRRRRGLSLATAAGLAGISKSYLSMLEAGERRFERRSLLDRLADALGCSVLDLTGEPYGPVDRRTADALLAIPEIQLALHDSTIEDVPDVPARPVDHLAESVHAANVAYLDRCRYDVAGRGLGQILTELQVLAVTQTGQTQRRALRLLVAACIAAFGVTKNLGHPDLALEATRRGYDAARRLGEPGPLAFASQRRAQALQRVGAHRRASEVLMAAIEAAEPFADPSAEQTDAAEGYGLLHLTAAMGAARLGDRDQAYAHLGEATGIATRSGERNSFGQHFGPANIEVWRVGIGVELQEGAQAAEHAMAANVDFSVLDSADRVGMMHLDLARALAQERGSRDWDAIRYLDEADRIAPQRIRQDPIARELVADLSNRARTKTWELGSVRHRFGLS